MSFCSVPGGGALSPAWAVSRPMKQTKESPNVGDVMSRDVVTVQEDIQVEEAAKLIVSGSFDHLPVVSKDGRLMGIITAWDISKAVASGKPSRIAEIMTGGSILPGLMSPLRLLLELWIRIASRLCR